MPLPLYRAFWYIFRMGNWMKYVWRSIQKFVKSLDKESLLISVLLILLATLAVYVTVLVKIIPFILGLAVTFFLGTSLPVIRNQATNDIVIDRPTKMNRADYKKIKKMSEGGKYIGCLERILYYISLVAATWENAAQLIAAILAFKVAAKWETWKNIVQVPSDKTKESYDDYSYFLFRRQWGQSVLVRFVVGTFSNILFAIIGYGVYSWLKGTFDP
jgi:hypothetical protein